jgi:hypothetical protein
MEWDIGGGAPDLYLGDNTGSATTTAVPDQFSASFPGPFEVSLIAGDTLLIYVWDADVSVPDYAFGCTANPVTAALLRTRSFGCTGHGASLASSISPK